MSDQQERHVLGVQGLRDLRELEIVRELARTVGADDRFTSVIEGAQLLTEIIRKFQEATPYTQFESVVVSSRQVGAQMTQFSMLGYLIAQVIYNEDGEYLIIAKREGKR